jgi:hypothetical protein
LVLHLSSVGRCGGIGDLLLGDGLELRLVDEQHQDVIADDEGLDVLVCQPLVRAKPNCAKKRADSARSFTGRLTAILVDTGASVVVTGGAYVEELLQCCW